MRVRMLTSISGSVTASPGDVVDIPSDVAKRLIDTDQAMPAKAAEAAARKPAGERATAKRARVR